MRQKRTKQNGSTRHSVTGITLIELLLAVAATAILLVLLLVAMSRYGRAGQVEAMLIRHAQEMRTLGRAALEHARANVATMLPEQGATATIAVADLIAAGRLPQGYTGRSTSTETGWTPIGQRFLILARRHGQSESDISILVTEQGQPDAAALARIGLDLDVEQVRLHKLQVLPRMAAPGMVGVAIENGSNVGVGHRQSFQYPLALYGYSPQAWPGLGLLVNAPELGEATLNTVIPPDGTQYQRCMVATGMTSDGVCPAGTVQVAQWHTCQETLLPTPIGTLTNNQVSQYRDPQTLCGGGCDPGISRACGPWVCRYIQPWELPPSVMDHSITAVVRLNGALIDRTTCERTWYTHRCTPGQSPPDCGVQGYTFQPTPPGVRSRLCCEPRS